MISISTCSMTQILTKLREVDPYNSDAVKDALATFYQNLPKHTEVDCYRWLRALGDVINRFPKYCMSHRATIETHLTHFLASSDYHNVIEAAKCAHSLQQVRPSHEKTATPKSSWRDQLAALCGAAHTLIGAVFPKAVDIYQHDRKAKRDPPTPSPLSSALQHITSVKKASGNASKRELNATRLRNVLVFIQAMLVETYPVAKPIRPQMVLDVIMRALSVSSGSGLDLSDVLAVKTQALRSLDALIACLGPNLIPFSPLVFRLVTQTLKWSSDNPSDEAREVRRAAYGSLGAWLRVLRAHRADARSELALADLMLADVAPPRRLVTLSAGAYSTKHLSKKAKRKLANTMLQESSIASHMPGEKNKISASEEVNDEVAIAALECAETFLTVCGMFLKPTTHKRFQERLVRECYNASEHSPRRALWLLRALDACRRAAPPAVPPPTQHCLQLYSALGNSEHGEISKFCSRALLDIRLQLHCSPPSLNFAIDAPPVEKQAEDRKRIMTERNRAALEELLGEDRLATLDEEDEEVISIADEPLSKRARLENEVTDKISVSSESNKSIEISDDSDEGAGSVQEVQIIIENAREDKDPPEMEIDDLDGNTTTEIDKRNEGTTNKVSNENVVIQNKEKSNDLIGSVDKNVNNDFVKQGSDKIEETDAPTHIKKINIYEASTQMPLNESIDTEEEESPLSMEVAYDYPNTAPEKVAVLEKIDNDNLPSTNDTDDIQITCGQVIKYSQEVDSVAKSDNPEAKLSGDVNANGIDESLAKVAENGFSDDTGDKGIVTVKVTSEEVSAIDMLANFVDEVNEDVQANTPV